MAAMIFADLHGISHDDFIADDDAKNAKSKRINDFINQFASTHHLKNVPRGRDFCPVRTTLMVAHCFFWATRSLPLFLMRLRNYMFKTKKVISWLKRWIRRRNRNVILIFRNWVRVEETQRKALQAKIYKECHKYKEQARASIPTYVKLHTTEEDKQRAAMFLYTERRTAFRKAFHKWYVEMTKVKKERDRLQQLIERPDVHVGADQKAKHGMLEQELARIEPLKPTFKFDMSTVTVSELMNTVTKSMQVSNVTPAVMRASAPGIGSDTSPVRKTGERRLSNSSTTGAEDGSSSSASGTTQPSGSTSPPVGVAGIRSLARTGSTRTLLGKSASASNLLKGHQTLQASKAPTKSALLTQELAGIPELPGSSPQGSKGAPSESSQPETDGLAAIRPALRRAATMANLRPTGGGLNAELFSSISAANKNPGMASSSGGGGSSIAKPPVVLRPQSPLRPMSPGKLSGSPVPNSPIMRGGLSPLARAKNLSSTSLLKGATGSGNFGSFASTFSPVALEQAKDPSTPTSPFSLASPKNDSPSFANSPNEDGTVWRKSKAGSMSSPSLPPVPKSVPMS